MGNYDVIIIGAGPAGLSAAIELKKQGVERVLVVEREAEAGGIPRHCGHPPFGMREFKRILTGPAYAKNLTQKALTAGVEIQTSVNVVELRENAELLISINGGVASLKGKRIIYATGARENSRSAQLISGRRPIGVINTGALQASVYLKHRLPFKRPVIIGSELVSFSAINTCRHAGLTPVAMIETSQHYKARWPIPYFAKLNRIPLYRDVHISSIQGDRRVEAVVLEDQDGKVQKINCDGVIISGGFTPESSLARMSHLVLDAGSGGPNVDQFGRCSDPSYFATGNVLRPIETAGWCWNESRQIAKWVADDLRGNLPSAASFTAVSTEASDNIKFAIPQRIAVLAPEKGMNLIQLRFNRRQKGDLKLLVNEKIVWQKSLSVAPERRVCIPLKKLPELQSLDTIRISFK